MSEAALDAARESGLVRPGETARRYSTVSAWSEAVCAAA